ncbi:MAG: response regulator, partial [bacterium]|nr:response regulator [bacterium]
EGEGSDFIVRLPLGKGHLTPDEIVSPDLVQSPPVFTDLNPIRTEDFNISPPGDEKENKNLTAPAELLEPGNGSDNKTIILVVEDNADLRAYISGAFETGYRIVEAKDGEEGIQQAQEVIPDLVISDIMMPKVDGYELCRTLKNDVRTSHIPIILLTAKASEENTLQG